MCGCKLQGNIGKLVDGLGEEVEHTIILHPVQ